MTRLTFIIVLLIAWIPTMASSMTPPAEHPRLYLRACDIPDLRERLASEHGQKVLARLKDMAEPRAIQEEPPVEQRDFRYYFQMRGLPTKAELLALDYLLEKDKSSAREAIEMMLDSLKKTDFPKSGDLSRASGVMLVAGAVVYDWCYDQLSSKEKSEFIGEFKRIASTMECGYPIKVVEPLAGHTCEWMIMRDMLSAGIAVYDEYPDMFNDAMDAIEEHFVPFRDFCYKAGNYHQGSKYLPTRYSAELFAQWIVSRMGCGSIFSEDQKSLLYDVIYRMRPDGMPLPAGDENPSPLPREENFALPAMLASSYYKDPYLRHLYNSGPEIISHACLFDLLWNDYSVEERTYDSLPLTRFCPFPFGWMIARTAWDENSVIFEAKINNQIVGNHQHLDGGAFQIYYKGALAIDSGIYEGSTGGYNSDHCRNYSKRTIAHNSLLIYDPQEKFAWYRHKGKQPRYCANDGGQRMPGATGWDPAGSMAEMLSEEYRTGQTSAYYSDSDWSYLKGDITEAYSDKVDSVKRSFVFCDMHSKKVPAVVVVMDEISAVDSSFRKVFLLHSLEEPSLDNKCGEYLVCGGPKSHGGILHGTVLWPSKPLLSKVGGEGHEFDVFGINYPNSVPSDPDLEAGGWRIELSPSSPSYSDVFLNVIEVSDKSNFRKAKIRRIETDFFRGAAFRSRMVLFCKSGAEKMEIRLSGRNIVIICDMPTGEWRIERNGLGHKSEIVSSEEGTIRFEARRGKYVISRQ